MSLLQESFPKTLGNKEQSLSVLAFFGFWDSQFPFQCEGWKFLAHREKRFEAAAALQELAFLMRTTFGKSVV